MATRDVRVEPEVSIHARARRATRSRRDRHVDRGFNPRPRAAGDVLAACVYARPDSFNPRPRAAGDHSPACSRSRGLRRFNPRPRAAGDDPSAASPTTRKTFQSTPARGGRRLPRRQPPSTGWNVSIHARTRRATRRPSRGIAPRPSCFNPRPRAAGDARSYRASRASEVSIHARARRATPSPDHHGTQLMFQSTPARGGRHRSRCSARIHETVSIHARTRRATAAPMSSYRRVLWFQSTPARGGRRRRPGTGSRGVHVFQSTPARGGRRIFSGLTCMAPSRFNPRPHAAGDGP